MSDTVTKGPETPAPAEEKAAVWEDFIDIFFTPSQVFERRRGWSAWPVLLVLTVGVVLLFVAWQQVLGPVLDQEMQRAMAEAAGAGEIGPAQVEQMRSFGRIAGAVGMAFSFPLGVLITALATWAITRMFGAAATFGAILGVVVYSQIVRVLQYVAGVFQGLFLDVSRMDSFHDVGFGPARFLDQPEASDLVLGLAARADLFVLWSTALIAVGLAVTTRLGRGRAWAVAAIVWLLAAVPPLIGGLLSP